MNLRPGLLVATLWLAVGTVWGTPVLTLDPLSGDLSGAPGSTLGWGFTITNDTDYIEITSAQFCINPVNFPLICNTPTTGTFTDFISGFNDIIVGPPGGSDPSTAMQAFDAIALTGIGEFVIDPATPSGASGIGQIVLTYTVTDLDPSNPNAQVLNTDLVLAANASVTAVAPEPLSATLIVLGLAALIMRKSLNAA